MMRKNKTIIEIFQGISSSLSKKRKFQLTILFFLMIFSGIGEMLSLASVIPYINLINNRDITFNNQYFNKVINLFNLNNDNFVYIFTFLLILIVLLTAAVRLLTITVNFRLAALIGNDIGVKAYRNFLHKEYIYHKTINTSSLISALTTKVTITTRVIRSFLQSLTSLIILISTISLLLIVNSKITIILFLIISFLYFQIASKSKKRLADNSFIVSQYNNDVVQTIQEGLGSIREIILYNFQDNFIKLFRSKDLKLRFALSNSLLIASFPRFILEAASIAALCIISLVLISQNKEDQAIIPLLSTFALASQRILPAAQLLYSGYIDIMAGSKASLDVLKLAKNNILLKELVSSNYLKEFKSIQFENVYFRYPDSQKYIIKNLSFKINAGENVGIIGKTGSGKSTLIDLIMGLLKPTKGKILINGNEINERNELMEAWKKYTAHVPQDIFLLDNTIQENITFGDKKVSLKKIKKTIKMAQMEGYINNLEKKLSTIVGERGAKISGGQRQRIGIARALYKEKNFLVLDEATSALDKNTEEKILKEIDSIKEKKTILMITHRLSTIKSFQRVLMIKDGIIKMDNDPSKIDISNEIYE